MRVLLLRQVTSVLSSSWDGLVRNALQDVAHTVGLDWLLGSSG